MRLPKKTIRRVSSALLINPLALTYSIKAIRESDNETLRICRVTAADVHLHTYYCTSPKIEDSHT